jgi:hypothetical protein
VAAAAAAPASNAFSFGNSTGGTFKTGGFSFGLPAPAVVNSSKPGVVSSNNENNNQKNSNTTTSPSESWKSLNLEISSHLLNENTSMDDCMSWVWKYVENARAIAKQHGILSTPKTALTTSTTTQPKSEVDTVRTAPASVTPPPPPPNQSTNSTTMSLGGRTGSTFSFGVVAPSSNTTVASSTNMTTVAKTENENDEEGYTNAEATEDAVLEQADPDWEDVGVYERIRVYRIENGAWKAFASAGYKLRLQKFKSGDRPLYRMLMRDTIGQKVFLNMTILKELKFQYAEQTNEKKNNVKAKITFTGINDAEKGPEVFMFVTSPTTGKSLHQNLQILASKTT